MTGLPDLYKVVFDTEAGTMSFVDSEDVLAFEAVTAPSGEDLTDLAGDYWSEELRRELQLRVDGDHLTASWADEVESTGATSIGADDYLVPLFIPVPWSPMTARLEFERSDSGGVSGLTLSCQMVSGVRFVRK